MNASNATTNGTNGGTRAANVVAVTSGLADAGCVTWWRLAGGLDLVRLRDVWLAAELPEHWLPAEPGTSTALRRAVGELREGHRLLRATSGDVLTIVDEEEVHGELEYRTTFKARLDKVGRLQVVLATTVGDREKVTEAFERYTTELTSQDVSTWLAKLMDRLDAVSLRDTGGVYFVPRFAMVQWQRAIGAIQEASKHAMLFIPAMRSEDAVRAVFDAVGEEVRREAEVIRAAVGTGTLGPRALRTRIATTEAAEQKLAQYEGLFGERLDGLHGLLNGLRAELSVAMLTAEAAEEAQQS